MVESLPFLVCFILIGGLYVPNVALVVGALNCFFRPLYTYQYIKYGSKARKLGAVLGTGSINVLSVITVGVIAKEKFLGL